MPERDFQSFPCEFSKGCSSIEAKRQSQSEHGDRDVIAEDRNVVTETDGESSTTSSSPAQGAERKSADALQTANRQANGFPKPQAASSEGCAQHSKWITKQISKVSVNLWRSEDGFIFQELDANPSEQEGTKLLVKNIGGKVWSSVDDEERIFDLVLKPKVPKPRQSPTPQVTHQRNNQIPSPPEFNDDIIKLIKLLKKSRDTNQSRQPHFNQTNKSHINQIEKSNYNQLDQLSTDDLDSPHTGDITPHTDDIDLTASDLNVKYQPSSVGTPSPDKNRSALFSIDAGEQTGEVESMALSCKSEDLPSMFQLENLDRAFDAPKVTQSYQEAEDTVTRWLEENEIKHYLLVPSLDYSELTVIGKLDLETKDKLPELVRFRVTYEEFDGNLFTNQLTEAMEVYRERIEHKKATCSLLLSGRVIGKGPTYFGVTVSHMILSEEEQADPRKGFIKPLETICENLRDSKFCFGIHNDEEIKFDSSPVILYQHFVRQDQFDVIKWFDYFMTDLSLLPFPNGQMESFDWFENKRHHPRKKELYVDGIYPVDSKQSLDSLVGVKVFVGHTEGYVVPHPRQKASTHIYGYHLCFVTYDRLFQGQSGQLVTVRDVERQCRYALGMLIGNLPPVRIRNTADRAVDCEVPGARKVFYQAVLLYPLLKRIEARHNISDLALHCKAPFDPSKCSLERSGMCDRGYETDQQESCSRGRGPMPSS